MTAWQSKLNFIVSGGLVGILVFAAMVVRKRTLQATGIGLAAATLIVLPAVLWKMAVSGGGLIEVLIHPVAGTWPGGEAFEAALRSKPWDERYPWSIFVPTAPGEMTTVLGVGLVALVLLRPGRDVHVWLVIGAAVLAILIPAAILAQSTARFLLEPLFWCLLAVAMRPAALVGWFDRGVRAVVSVQGMATIAMAAFGGRCPYLC